MPLTAASPARPDPRIGKSVARLPSSPVAREAFRLGLALGREITQRGDPLVAWGDPRRSFTSADWAFTGFVAGALVMLAIVAAAH